MVCTCAYPAPPTAMKHVYREQLGCYDDSYTWCFAYDTPILMSDGSHRPIQDVANGEDVAVFLDGQLTTSQVALNVDHGEQPVTLYNVTLDDGQSVEVTHGHHTYTNGEIKPVQDARRGDVMLSMHPDSQDVTPHRVVSVTKRTQNMGVANLLVKGHLIANHLVVPATTETDIMLLWDIGFKLHEWFGFAVASRYAYLGWKLDEAANALTRSINRYFSSPATGDPEL